MQATAVEKKKPVKVIEPAVVEEPIPAEVMNIAVTGNNGELRSEARPGEKPRNSGGLFAGLFGGASAGSVSLLPETRALDAALAQREARKPFKVKPEFEPQEVEFSGYEPGTIVIDTSARRLYLVNSRSSARRYAIAVGKEGLQYKAPSRSATSRNGRAGFLPRRCRSASRSITASTRTACPAAA